MAYGGRAYDDDKPWWKDDSDDNDTSSKPTNTSQRTVDEYDDFDSPPPSSKPQTNTKSEPTNFHGNSHDNSYGVYNPYGPSAYDDNVTYSNNTQKNNNNADKQANNSYDAILSKSKYNNNAYSNAYSNANPLDNNNKSNSNKAKSQPVASKSKYNGYKKKDVKKTQSQSNKNHYNNKQSNASYSRRSYGDDDKGISNPAYRNMLKNKYRNGNIGDEYTSTNKRGPRQRPELHTMEQRQEYKQELKEKTKAHLDQGLRTAYQSEELAADTSERLYCQRKQLENVDKMLHETDQNLDRTEHTLKGMKSIWGGIGNYFKKAPEKQAYEKRKSNVEKMNVNNKMMEFEKEKARRGYHKKSKQVSLGGNVDEDDEFNDKLDELHKSVQRMKLMAQNMNNELDDQSNLLENIDDKMGKVDARIHKQNYTMNRIK